jgi:hypothetical protein
VLLPQDIPSVSRAQPAVSVSVVVFMVHVPLAHTASVRVRVRVPEVAQASAYVQELHGPKVVVPQLAPSVKRVQLCVSVVLDGPQVPVALHVWSVRVRVWVPLVAQTLAPDEQTPQPVYVVCPQDVPASARASAGQLGEVPVQRSSTSQGLAAGRQMREAPSSAQVPLVGAPAAALHASQSPAHAESQHTPSTQKLDKHSPGPLQGAPRARLAAQYVPLQKVFGGQPLVQRMGQSGSVPLQTTLPPHAGMPGSFAGAGRHRPSWPGRLQRSQLPVQAASQQTPSAQKEEWHSTLD